MKNSDFNYHLEKITGSLQLFIYNMGVAIDKVPDDPSIENDVLELGLKLQQYCLFETLQIWETFCQPGKCVNQDMQKCPKPSQYDHPKIRYCLDKHRYNIAESLNILQERLHCLIAHEITAKLSFNAKSLYKLAGTCGDYNYSLKFILSRKFILQGNAEDVALSLARSPQKVPLTAYQLRST